MSKELITIEEENFHPTLAREDDLQDHINDVANPHNTSKSQMGLGNVENVSIQDHIDDTSNPHSVTKSNLGIDNVENIAISTWTGSSNLETVGTISSGTWEGNTIDAAFLDLAGIDIGDLDSFDLSSLQDYDLLQYNAATQKWENTSNLVLQDDIVVYDYTDSIPEKIFEVDNANNTTRIGNIYSGNYSEFESDGTLEFNGDAVVWDDLRYPAVAFEPGPSRAPDFDKFKDDGGGSQGVFIYFFDGSTEEELYGAAQLPHGYKLGTDLHPHVHFIVPTSGASGEFVQWGLEYTISDIGGTFSNTNIIYTDASTAATATTSGDGTLTADKHYRAEFPQIDCSSITGISAMIVFRIFRDATDGADDYPNDAGLLEFDFHYQIDTVGSRSENIK
jgi:hypothetical protein